MKILTIVFILLFSKAIAQNKDSIFTLESYPVYDENGNETRYIEKFNYVPTSEDTAAFIKSGRGIMTKEAKEQNEKDLENFMKEYYEKQPANIKQAQKKKPYNKPKKKA